MPRASTLALLVNPTNPVTGDSELRGVQTAALVLGLDLVVVRAATEREIDLAFANLAQPRAVALIVAGDRVS